MENTEKLGIENIKLVLEIVANIVKIVKTTGKPLLSILFSLGKALKLNFKQISAEVRDIDAIERAELISFIVDTLGFKLSVAEKAIKNIESQSRTTILNLSKTLLKSK